MKSIISLIAAMSENRVIGDGKRLVWNLPDDFRWFKEKTIGKPVIMGRKTFDSLGGALPNRPNIVITRQSDWQAPGVIVTHGLLEALKKAQPAEEIMIIGGAQIYAEALPLADRLYLTRVHGKFEGSVTFPSFDRSAWRVIATQYHPADERHAVAFTIETLEKQ